MALGDCGASTQRCRGRYAHETRRSPGSSRSGGTTVTGICLGNEARIPGHNQFLSSRTFRTHLGRGKHIDPKWLRLVSAIVASILFVLVFHLSASAQTKRVVVIKV